MASSICVRMRVAETLKKKREFLKIAEMENILRLV